MLKVPVRRESLDKLPTVRTAAPRSIPAMEPDHGFLGGFAIALIKSAAVFEMGAGSELSILTLSDLSLLTLARW